MTPAQEVPIPPFHGGLPALPAVAGGLRAGGEHHHVRVEALDLLRLHRGVEPHHHLEFPELALVPVDEVEDLRAARLHPGEPELSSRPVRRLGEGDAMAAFRRKSMNAGMTPLKGAGSNRW